MVTTTTEISGEDLRPKVLVINQPIALKLNRTIITDKFRLVSGTDPDAVSATALLGNNATVVDAELFRRFPAIRIFVSFATGIERVDMEECRRRGVAVVNAGDMYAADVADHAVGMLMDVARRVSASDRYVRAGLWRSNGDYTPLGFKLRGKRIGIVGLGNIGLAVAKRLKPFGCEICYNSRTQKEASQYTFFSTAKDLAANCDAVILCCSLSNETRHVANGELMSALGKNGILINIGRGGLVDEKELVRRLVALDIAGAGLDVFEDEPNVPSELFGLDNVVLTPHIAAFTPESFRGVAERAVSNLEAFFSNKPLITPLLPSLTH